MVQARLLLWTKLDKKNDHSGSFLAFSDGYEPIAPPGLPETVVHTQSGRMRAGILQFPQCGCSPHWKMIIEMIMI